MKLISAALIVTSALTLFAPVRGGCSGGHCYHEPPTPSPTTTLCDGDQDSDFITVMNLTDSIVIKNTLHLSDGELRFKDVGKNKGKSIDLSITVNTEAESSYKYTNILEVWEERGKPVPSNGKNVNGSAFGKINVQTVFKKPNSGEGNFQFCLIDSDTDELIKNNFTFSIFDMDQRGADNKTDPNAMVISLKEKFSIDLEHASYTLSNATEIQVKCEKHPYTLDNNGKCPSGVRTVFFSSTPGNGADNPTTVYDLTEQQKNRAVAITFEDTDCFNITFDQYCPCEQSKKTLKCDIEGNKNLKCEKKGGKPKCNYYSGGNFLFAGNAPEIMHHCPTNPPTLPPTLEPTTICDKGQQVFLENQIGAYHPSIDLNEAVTVVSQATATVTVALNNVWLSSDIYYQYRDTIVNEECGMVENVTEGLKNYTEIIIKCLHLKKYAKFDIWVVDKESHITNSAEIPGCCNPPHGSYSAVKYTFAVNCECYEYPTLPS